MVFFRKEKVAVLRKKHPLDVKMGNKNDNQEYGKFNQKAMCKLRTFTMCKGL